MNLEPFPQPCSLRRRKFSQIGNPVVRAINSVPAVLNALAIARRLPGHHPAKGGNFVAGSAQRAFSLVELLVVVGIIMVLSAIVGPAITGVKKGSELTSISYGLSEALQQARTHAMARNTHVYVGIGATTGGSVQGIVLGAAASKDGLAAVDAGALQVSRLAPITRALRFDGVRLSNLSGKSGAEYAGADQVANASPGMTMTWPLNASGAPQYQLDRIIEFTPEGTATRLLSPAAVPPRWVEIGLVPDTRAGVPGDEKNYAVVQLAGITGGVRTFRP